MAIDLRSQRDCIWETVCGPETRRIFLSLHDAWKIMNHHEFSYFKYHDRSKYHENGDSLKEAKDTQGNFELIVTEEH